MEEKKKAGRPKTSLLTRKEQQAAYMRKARSGKRGILINLRPEDHAALAELAASQGIPLAALIEKSALDLLAVKEALINSAALDFELSGNFSGE